MSIGHRPRVVLIQLFRNGRSLIDQYFTAGIVFAFDYLIYPELLFQFHHNTSFNIPLFLVGQQRQILNSHTNFFLRNLSQSTE